MVYIVWDQLTCEFWINVNQNIWDSVISVCEVNANNNCKGGNALVYNSWLRQALFIINAPTSPHWPINSKSVCDELLNTIKHLLNCNATYKTFVRTNLIARVSRIHGHKIHVVLYACLDGDFLLYWSRLRGLYTDAPPPD